MQAQTACRARPAAVRRGVFDCAWVYVSFLYVFQCLFMEDICCEFWLLNFYCCGELPAEGWNEETQGTLYSSDNGSYLEIAS